MNCSTPGLPVHHHLPEFTQIHFPSSQWCHPAISSSVVPFSSWPQSLPASESFPMSQLFTWGGQSTGVLALASFLHLGEEDPLEKKIATHSSMLAWKISWTESCSPWGCNESGTTERLTLTLIFKKPNFIIKLNYHITNKIRLIEEIFYWLVCARYFPPS